jgi:hypothetical protein
MISLPDAVFVGHVSRLPPGMQPVHFDAPHRPGGFWVVHIIPEYGGEGRYEGLLALADLLDGGRNPARWREDLAYEGHAGLFQGAFRCARFSYAGGRVFGPAPRNMDTMEIEINKDGYVTVHTMRVKKGGQTPIENAARAVPIVTNATAV